MDWVQTTPSFLFSIVSVLSLGAPQRLILPVAWWEAHSSKVNFGVFCKMCLHLILHVITWRYDVEEIFDDAQIKIGAHGVGRQRNPASCRITWYGRQHGITFVPYPRVMSTCFASDCYNGHPWLKDTHLQSKSFGYTLTYAVLPDIHSKWRSRCQWSTTRLISMMVGMG